MSVLFTVDGSAMKPVVVTHNNEGDRNPFGPTYCYGIPGLIVEVSYDFTLLKGRGKQFCGMSK